MTPADKRATLIAYLRMKADECDWHGVCDAANDLRELEAKHGYLTYALDRPAKQSTPSLTDLRKFGTPVPPDVDWRIYYYKLHGADCMERFDRDMSWKYG